MLRLYNSLSGRKEPLGPSKSPVTIYVCGVTPYDTTHVGHAFMYVVFDVLHRYLRFLGHRVCYVSNITDVDDSILERARQRGIDYRELGRQQTERLIQDLEDLHVLAPDVQPRASHEIPTMIEIIDRLLEQEAAYVADGWVYFQVSCFPSYGQLSKHDREEMLRLSAERGADPRDGRKRDPLDFVLWQPSLPDEPSWPSPWGPGRPGWHLECSAMSIRYLGDSIDIHGGGADLLYPHHESEIAQSELFTGNRPFARFWMHNGMVRYKGEKMSKSLGNLVLAHDLLQRHSATAIRLYFLSFPYREGWDFVEEDMQRFDEMANQYASAAKPVHNHPLAADDSFLAALDDDLDTPRALSVLKERLAAAVAGDRAAAEQLSVYGEVLGLEEE